MLDRIYFRLLLDRWYRNARRDLPWRSTRDPYCIWISEIMLQQTRVTAVLPYYERFLALFPDVEALAAAPEADVLAAWAGLGYYSRARNLQKAAKAIAASPGGFPKDYAKIRALPGVGDYTAAAVASIAFGLPHAVLDGNVIRVLTRISNDDGDIEATATQTRLRELAGAMLDRERPGDFNQAMMELGATICLPRDPQCLVCPVAELCAARRSGTPNNLPVKTRRIETERVDLEFLAIQRDGAYLLWRRPEGAGRMAGFWELPERAQLPDAAVREPICRFRHTITNHLYSVTVLDAEVNQVPGGFEWVAPDRMEKIPLSTLARKALRQGSAR